MRAIIIAAATTIIAGCAAELPVRQLARTEAAVRAADDKGAEEIPRAAAYLKMAEDSLELARAYMATDEMDKAEAALDRSRYDAEIALALAREEETRAKARQARRAVEVLRTSGEP